MPDQIKQMIDLAELSDFIIDADHQIEDQELVEILREIYSLVERVQKRIKIATDNTEIEKLTNLKLDGTISHEVALEWKNRRMGIRKLILRTRNHITILFSLITKLDEQQELQIDLVPRPRFLVGRFRTALFETTIPASEIVVDDSRENLKGKSATIIDKSGFVEHGYARAKLLNNQLEVSLFDLIANFRDSLRKAVEQLGA